MNPISPCPFCESRRVTLVIDDIGGSVSVHVCCSNCLAQGPVEATSEKAADRWESLRKPESAVPGEPVKSEAFMCGYERAQGRWEATHDDRYNPDACEGRWDLNPFEEGSDEQKGFSQGIYDLTK